MTIYEIAAEAGVSASTVSRVINNKSGVNPELRAKIQALLKQHHYSPDIGARGLSTGAYQIVGILLEDIRTLQDAESAYTIERELAKEGYNSLIINSGRDDQDKQRAIRALAARRCDGCVIVGSAFENKTVQTELKQYIPDTPVIMAGAYLPLPNVYGVLVNDEEGVFSCVRYLSEKGRKQIAFVNYADTPASKLKEKGYRNGIRQFAKSAKPLVKNLNRERLRDASFRATKELVSANVDAVIYADDYIALAGLSEIQRLGKKVPADIAVMGINNSPYGDLSFPRMTSLDTKVKELSTICAHSLTDIIEGRSIPHKTMVFSEIAIGETA